MITRPVSGTFSTPIARALKNNRQIGVMITRTTSHIRFGPLRALAWKRSKYSAGRGSL